MVETHVCPAHAYLAPEGFLPQLETELGIAGPGDATFETHGRLILGPVRPVAWAANTWLAPEKIAIASIGDAAKKLRAIQRNWVMLPHLHHRRAALIAEQLPKVSAKPIRFGDPAPTAPLGSWMLLAPDLLLASPRCSSPFPHGEPQFVEDRAAPPSRAYLKLWEAFTVLGAQPRPGETCIDLGASPGGWSWVLSQTGATVTSVDKAPLDPRIAALPNIDYRAESAFAIEPRTLAHPFDWLFSDVVCYPARLLGLVQNWIAAGAARRFICTIKFQGSTDFETMRAFAAIPGSRLMHLHANKHELTWVRL
jgi:23S rRNA (cytidine2498-2'-O)-methyltransferase